MITFRAQVTWQGRLFVSRRLFEWDLWWNCGQFSKNFETKSTISQKLKIRKLFFSDLFFWSTCWNLHFFIIKMRVSFPKNCLYCNVYILYLQDLSVMVSEQGESIERIESHVYEAEVKTTKAREEMKQAKWVQSVEFEFFFEFLKKKNLYFCKKKL